MEKVKNTIDTSKKNDAKTDKQVTPESAKEINGRQGLEPTRYGDWEKNGRCIDF